MLKKDIKWLLLLIIPVMFLACTSDKKAEPEKKEFQLDLTVRLEGKALDGAKVTVNGIEEGTTDKKGKFSKVLKEAPGKEVTFSVSKEKPGYKINSWTQSFVMKEPGETPLKYVFEATLEWSKYITLFVSEDGRPLGGVSVTIGGKKSGETNQKGELVYKYRKAPKKGLAIAVSQKGYSSWKKRKKLNAGERVNIELYKQSVVAVKAMTDEYGFTKGVPGITVAIDGKTMGKTRANGSYLYKYKGKPGKKVLLSLSAPGFIPDRWEQKVVLDDDLYVQRYFYPATPKPIRVGIVGYVNNSPEEPMDNVISRIEEAVGNRLFSYMSFKGVPRAKLLQKMNKSKTTIEKMTTRGWQKTKLMRTVDMVILGSVAKKEKGYIFETKVYTSSGKLLLSQISTAKKAKHIKKVAKKLVNNIMRQFPFEGTVAAAEEDEYKINLGKVDYGVRKGMEFSLMEARLDNQGKVKSFSEIGTFKVKSAKSDVSWGEVEFLKAKGDVKVGSKVVRRLFKEEEQKAARNFFILKVNGGLPPDVTPLAGTNVYLDGRWVGTTDRNGKAKVPVKLGKGMDIVLYRHGYKQLVDEVWIEKEMEEKAFVLNVNNALFKVESAPSNAAVFIDGKNVGTTPIVEGKSVTFGFHKIKISAPGNYRHWEKIIDFKEKVVDRTGSKKIVLFKDTLKIGREAERNGNVDAAIKAYANAEKNHPDYSDIRHSLARLYMDEKKDYVAAIREFENVLTLPENKQLVYKQFAVTYTNLGHAYYEHGNSLLKSDKREAAKNFAAAIKNLERAKQNTRFFPTAHYDEAVHDTYYYRAISFHKLYMATRKNSILNKADLAWREYFDFFPKKLESDGNFAGIREAAQKRWTQIKDLM
ncbi:MAG: PEGA domain-containing protein [Deltaproteobacteria bacterium]|nr:PEGA domain-containing protein [Deltaproteobacteria bacterium]